MDASRKVVTMDVSQLSPIDQRYCEIAKPFVAECYRGINFIVLEYVPEGIIVKETGATRSIPTYEIMLLRGNFESTTTLHGHYGSDVYKVGTYDYTPADGKKPSRIRAFVTNLDAAVTMIEPRLAQEPKPSPYANRPVQPTQGGGFRPPGPAKARPSNDTIEPPSSPVVPTGPRKRNGSGFAVTSNGYIVTSEHVVRGAGSVFVVINSISYGATVVNADAANDLALIKIGTPTVPLKIGPGEPLVLGDSVSVLGYPDSGVQGASTKLLRGSVRGLLGFHDDERQLQIDVPIQPDVSGGPLLNQRKVVVGVVDSIPLGAKDAESSVGSASGLGFAVKIKRLTSLIDAVPGLAGRIASEDFKTLTGATELEKGVYLIKVENVSP